MVLSDQASVLRVKAGGKRLERFQEVAEGQREEGKERHDCHALHWGFILFSYKRSLSRQVLQICQKLAR